MSDSSLKCDCGCGIADRTVGIRTDLPKIQDARGDWWYQWLRDECYNVALASKQETATEEVLEEHP